MKNMFNLTKTISFVFVLSLLVFAWQSFADQPPFSATIDLAAGDTELVVGESTTITAAFHTNRAVTRESWAVDGIVVQGPNATTSGTGADAAADSSFLFNATTPGFHEVCYRIWHHTQLITDGRDAHNCVTIHVTAPPPTEDCPAAPAVANHYLNELDIKGQDRDQYSQQVAQEMAKNDPPNFHGYAPCDAGYVPEVRAFVDTLLPH
jgi:hypothetical protein